ncbi:CoA ester lyase [Paracoccus marcusii]|uniref:HpcH/HpaI aldolase/citrate lyase family protein n=1 Tax=Paracoccus marcusii TaxID=59779 RepID=UPI00326615AA
MARPYRSVLYIPAANARAMEKARGLAADAIIFDLEDAVAPDAKAAARDALAQALTQDYGPRARIVRINALSTEWGADDASACAGLDIDAVLIPKVDGPDDLDRVAALIPDTPLWAMMETPLGMLNAAAIAAHPRLAGMVMGTNDLAKDLGSRFRADRLPMMAGLGLCLLAAKAHGAVIVDGVFNAFKDEDGLRAECEQGRDMGFDGKTLIHPAQLDIANAAFAPTEEEVALARRQIEAFDAATAQGQGVAVVDGRIVENLHVATARQTLDRAQAIAAMAQ